MRDRGICCLRGRPFPRNGGAASSHLNIARAVHRCEGWVAVRRSFPGGAGSRQGSCMSSDDRSGTSSASPRTVLLWTIVIASMANAALAAARLVVPIFALALGASVELVGITVALFTAIPTFFSVPFGRWVDRSGTFSPLVFSAVLIALGGVATIVLASKFMLLFTGALVGSGAIFAHIVATRAVGEIGIREDRGRNPARW